MVTNRVICYKVIRSHDLTWRNTMVPTQRLNSHVFNETMDYAIIVLYNIKM